MYREFIVILRIIREILIMFYIENKWYIRSVVLVLWKSLAQFYEELTEA